MIILGVILASYLIYASSVILPLYYSKRVGQNVLYFDGVCGLCNKTVNTLLSWDKKGSLLFSPLQGSNAKQHLTIEQCRNLDSIVFRQNHKSYTESDAVFRAIISLGNLYSLLGLLLYIPSPIRNFGYNLVAKNRYIIFGKTESCRLPTPDERARFLD